MEVRQSAQVSTNSQLENKQREKQQIEEQQLVARQQFGTAQLMAQEQPTAEVAKGGVSYRFQSVISMMRRFQVKSLPVNATFTVGGYVVTVPRAAHVVDVVARKAELDKQLATTKLDSTFAGSIKEPLTQVTELYHLQMELRKRKFAGYFTAGVIGCLFIGAPLIKFCFPAGAAFFMIFGAVMLSAIFKNAAGHDRLGRIGRRIKSFEVKKGDDAESKDDALFMMKLAKFVVKLDEIDCQWSFGSRCSALLNEIETALYLSTSIDELKGALLPKIEEAAKRSNSRWQNFFAKGEEQVFRDCCKASGLSGEAAVVAPVVARRPSQV